MREFEPSQEIYSEQTEDHYPQGEECLAVEDMPSIGKVGHRQELQSEGEFDESQYHLHHIHPSSRFRCRFQQTWEHGEESERNGKGDGKSEHTDGGGEDAALSAHCHKQESDDRTCA